MRTLALLSAAFLAGCGKSAPPTTEGGENRPVGTKPAAPVAYAKMTVDELIAEWKRNPAAAAAKYKGAGVEVTGTLHEIDSWPRGGSLVTLTGAEGVAGTVVRFIAEAPKAKDGLLKCEVGKPVVVKGRGDGKTNDAPWLLAGEIAPK